MEPEVANSLVTYGVIALKIFGATSVLGALGFFAAYYAFPPNLSIVEVKDKGKVNYESRLIFKNIGQLPAYHVVADVERMNVVIGGLNMTNMSATDCGFPVERLAAGESMECPVCPHVKVPPGSALTSCDYELIMKFEQRLPFVKKALKRRWHIELRNAGTEFTWQASLR